MDDCKKRKNLSDMMDGNKERYCDFFERYYRGITGRSVTTRDLLIKDLQKLIDTLNLEINVLSKSGQAFDPYTKFPTSKSEFDKKNIAASRQLLPIKKNMDDPEIPLYANDTRPYIDISELFNVKAFNMTTGNKLTDLDNAFLDFQQTFTPLNAINANVFDWKHLDPLQDNIGSVQSLIQFFFNFMMCYPAPLVKSEMERKEANPFPNNVDGFYLPLPKEWYENGGLLDRIMDTTSDSYRLLKVRGIPIHIIAQGTNTGDYVRAYIPIEKDVSAPKMKVWDVDWTKQNERMITSPYITQPIKFIINKNEYNGGAINNQPWSNIDETIKKGGYYRAFILNTADGKDKVVEGQIPNRCLSPYRTNMFNQFGQSDINKIADGSEGSLGGYTDLLGYINGQNTLETIGIFDGDGNNFVQPNSGTNNSSLGIYFSNIYRTLYDIVYSNSAFIGAKMNPAYHNQASNWYLYGLDSTFIYNNTLNVNLPINVANEVGGYVGINGGILGTNYQIPNSSLNVKGGNINLNQGGIGLSNIFPSMGFHINQGPDTPQGIENVVQFRSTSTARTAYNAMVLRTSINPNIKNGYIDATKDNTYDEIVYNIIGLNVNLEQESWDLSTNNSTGNSVLDKRFSKTSDSVMQNLWLSNSGGYLNDIKKNGNTPLGLLTARYNISKNADDDLDKDFPLMDSVPNDDVIEAVIWKFAKIIFNNLNKDYQMDVNNKNNYIKYFAYRLSRAIIIVKNSLFNAPIFKEYSEDIVGDYKNNGYFGGRFSGDNIAACLYGTESNGYNINNDLAKRQNSATYCQNSQPLTIALTTMFRLAFTRMMNKAILTRHFNRDDKYYYYKFSEIVNTINVAKQKGDKKYGLKTADELVDDKYYITGCAGKCDSLVELDISDILTMEDSDFYYYEYLRNCLDTDMNIIKWNFEFKNMDTFRPCAAGITQLKNINYNSMNDIARYLKQDVYLSKLTFLSKLQSIDGDVDKERKIKFQDIYNKIQLEVQPVINDITGAILNKQAYKANAGFATLIARVRGAINTFKNVSDLYNEENQRINQQLNELNNLLESEKDLDYNALDKRIGALYTKKEKILNNYEDNYNKIVPNIIVVIQELRQLKKNIDDPRQFTGLSTTQKQTLSTKVEDVADRLVRVAEVQIPSIVSDLLDQTDVDKLTNLEGFMEYILKDPVLKGGIWVPIKAGLFLTLAIKERTITPAQYKLFNIFTGELINLTDKTDLKAKNLKGKVLISTTKDSKDWYFYKELPDTDKIKSDYAGKDQYLNDYRKRLIETYGQMGFFDMIIQPWVKQVLYTMGSGQDLTKVKKLDVGKLIHQ